MAKKDTFVVTIWSTVSQGGAGVEHLQASSLEEAQRAAETLVAANYGPHYRVDTVTLWEGRKVA